MIHVSKKQQVYWNDERKRQAEQTRKEKERIAEKLSKIPKKQGLVSHELISRYISQDYEYQPTELPKKSNSADEQSLKQLEKMKDQIDSLNKIGYEKAVTKQFLLDNLVKHGETFVSNEEPKEDFDGYNISNFYDSNSSKPKEYHPQTSSEDLIPIFVDPYHIPQQSYLRFFLGGRGYEKEWLIIRNFEDFKKTIIELFGEPKTPTVIPMMLSSCFFLTPQQKTANDILEEVWNRNKYEDIEFYEEEFLINPIQKFIKSSEKPIYKKSKDEITGLDCIEWLINNNYIPERFNLHDKEYHKKYKNNISETVSSWQTVNNVYPATDVVWDFF